MTNINLFQFKLSICICAANLSILRCQGVGIIDKFGDAGGTGRNLSGVDVDMSSLFHSIRMVVVEIWLSASIVKEPKSQLRQKIKNNHFSILLLSTLRCIDHKNLTISNQTCMFAVYTKYFCAILLSIMSTIQIQWKTDMQPESKSILSMHR